MDEFSSATSKFKGVIHDLRVWNRNISNVQISSNTTVYQSGYEEFLAGYWQANGGSGYAFQWKKNGTNITGATTSTYNATTAGAYTVAITSPCGNATSAATTVNIANVTASITPSGNVSVCAGSASNYTANSGFNYTYQWKRNGVAVAGATNQTYSNNSAGSYTVVVTQGGVCSATSSATVLTVINNPTPTITAQGPTTFCAGQSVVLAANTYAGVTYQWQKNSTDIAGATNQNYTATTAGTYRVKQTANGCLKTSGTIAVTVNCRVAGAGFGEEHAGYSDIKVIPNPFKDEFQVVGLRFEVGDKYQMINVLGELVLKETVRHATTNLKLQTSNLKPGVYFLQVLTANERKVVKVVRE